MTTGIETLIRTSVDTWTDKAHSSANKGGSAVLSVNGDATNTRYAYVFFARPFPLGATVFAATLDLYLYLNWAGSNTITAKRITESWNELGLTWDNAPAVSTTHSATASVSAGVDGDLVTLDLTDMLNDVSGGSEWYGVRLEVDTTSNRFLYSSEHPTQANRPVLDIDWGIAPEAPVNLNPTGNQAVGQSQPTLDWQFATDDHSAKRTQSYSQVQVNSTTDFTSPDYDSGYVANTTSQWDLSAASSPTFTALADGDTAYWRVRIKDDQGMPSDWSETSRFRYVSKGTLTVSNPPDASPSEVNDLTPKIAWSFSGRTQEAFEIRLFQYDGTTPRLVWKLPRTVSTATSYNIPKGYIKTGEAYKLSLFIWDTIDRAVTPGSTDFVVLTRDFNYDRGGDPDPVLNLTASTAFDPAVALTWTRSVAPDYFCLKANGVEIFPRIDPADVLVSGTTYGMNFWRAIPDEATTYEVEAVEDDGSGNFIHSALNDTETATISPHSIHLVDETDDKHVQIDGDDPAGFDIRISSTTYDMIGSRRAVQVIDAIGGYTGTITGVVDATNRDKFEELIGRTPTPLRLILSDYNLNVELVSGAPTPTPIPGRDVFEVTFTFNEITPDDSFTVVGG